MFKAISAANRHFAASSANTAEGYSFCPYFMSAAAVLTGDAIVVASIFIIASVRVLSVQVSALAVAALLVGVAVIISHDNLITRHKLSEPRD